MSAARLFRGGKLDDAERLYADMLRQYPENFDILRILGLINMRKGNRPGALNFFSRALSEWQRAGRDREKEDASQCFVHRGIVLQELDRNEEAVASCRAALSINPGNFHAYNALGNAYSAMDRLPEAVEAFERALSLESAFAEIHLNLGKALGKQRKYEAAAAAVGKALSLDPCNAEAHLTLGIFEFSLQKTDTAKQCLLDAIKRRPDYHEAYTVLGRIFHAEKNHDQAVVCFRKSLELAPDSFEAYYHLGNTFSAQERPRDAAACFQKAITLKPGLERACYRLGTALMELDRPDEAAERFRQALAIKPDFAEAWNGMGNVYREKQMSGEALAHYLRALELQPDSAEIYCNMSNAYMEDDAMEAALACCEKAISMQGELPEAHWNRAMVLLTMGNFDEGWTAYEWRLKKRGAVVRQFPQPRWTGESLKGTVLLVTAEQGVGDELMFASCLNYLPDEAGLCIVECDSRLLPLFKRSFGRVKFVPRLGSYSEFPGDLPIPEAFIEMGSLPQFVRPDLKGVAPGAYLRPDPDTVRKWRIRYEALGPGLKIGVSWRGGKDRFVRRIRSIDPREFGRIIPRGRGHLIDLQYGAGLEELEDVRRQTGVDIHHWEDADPLRNIDDFAAQIAALDMVISVDNSTVHLAGALGVTTWVLLPKSSDWRWLRDREDTLWYESVRLFRQDRRGEWDGPIARIRALL